MFNSTMIMEVVGTPHKPGDIIRINYERWVVVQIHCNHTHSTIHLEPLVNVLAKDVLIPSDVYGQYSIAEYLKILCDEYEYDCKGEKYG